MRRELVDEMRSQQPARLQPSRYASVSTRICHTRLIRFAESDVLPEQWAYMSIDSYSIDGTYVLMVQSELQYLLISIR